MSESNVPFPQYFLAKWKEKEGYGPVTMRNQYLRYHALWNLCLAVIFLISMATPIVCVKAKMDHDVRLYAVIAAMGFALLLLAIALFFDAKSDRCREKVNRFTSSLEAVACRLGKKTDELAKLDLEDAKRIAMSTLEGFAKCVRAVEAVTDTKSHPARERLRGLVEDYCGIFQRWDLIPPTD